MAYQTAGNVLAAIKREAIMGTAEPAGAGASQLRLIDSPGLTLGRANITSGERRKDQVTNLGRLGGKNVGGSYNTELTVGGAIDLLLESIARGTWEAKATHVDFSAGTQLRRVIAPPVPIYHSYSIEQYDADIDASELFFGCRLVQLALGLRPNDMTSMAWTFAGLDRNVIAPAAAPHFTSPMVTTGLPMIADDSSIYYNGVQIAVLTGLDVTFAIANGLQPVIGSFVSPDVFMNDLTITGSLTAVRQDLQALTDFNNETEFEIRASLSVPGAEPKETFGIRLPRVKISSVDAPFQGGDGAKVETRNLMIGPAVGGTAVEFYSSTETPTAVV